MSKTRIVQYVHRPNSTELGQGNTHETYMLINSETDLSELFPVSVEVTVEDTDTKKSYKLKSANGREFRVNQMGEIYRDHNVLPGDEILITQITKEGNTKHCVTVKNYNRVVLMVGSNGTEIVNINRLDSAISGENKYSLDIYDRGNHNTLEISFKEAKKKRSDSPTTTNYYNVTVNGSSLPNGTYYLSLSERSTISTLVKSSFNEIIFDDSMLNNLSESSEVKHDIQQIFYGAPGTGKSHEVKKITRELLANGDEVDLPNVFRTTFHPDTDYASFVGCYKPTMKPTSKEEKTLTGKDEEIVYEFVPQVFTDAYVYAYNNSDQPTYLVIEEINRGNCAQIFGDLFQLLDRKNGKSEYKIKADNDLAKYLREQLGADSEGIQDGKLCLPANLHILATMNTSDQSLFPMDSAFKRRWDWEYVPINYNTSIESGTFVITIGDKSYSWVDFIKQVNEKIFDLTQSEDKQMGNFFIKHSIDEDGFKSKVMFYLWYEVLRDETESNKYFFYKKTTVDGREVSSKFTFKDLYGDQATETLQQFMEYLKVSPK